MEIRYLGLLSYSDALGIMESLHQEIVENPKREGVLLVVQHLPTVTMGKRELYDDMKIPPEQLKFKGIAFHKIDRGGSVTVHEPGQVVVYPIVHMEDLQKSVRTYVNLLEEAMIATAAQFGISVTRDAINPGVWVGQKKIGAVGIRIANKVTKHGIAFNVTNSLETFSSIIPCGLRGRGVISLQMAVNELCLSQNLPTLAIDYPKVEKILVEEIHKLLN